MSELKEIRKQEKTSEQSQSQRECKRYKDMFHDFKIWIHVEQKGNCVINA